MSPKPPHPPKPPTPPPSSPAPPLLPPLKPGGVDGDPHLHFAHGGEADFRGEDGAVYAMLHHTGLAVNALFEASAFFLASPPNLKVHGTFVTDVFLRLRCEASGRLLRIEFSPNQPPTPVAHGLPGGTKMIQANAAALLVEDISIFTTKSGAAETLHVSTAAWAINATSRPIWRSATPGKKQIDLSLTPLRDPLSLQPSTGKVVAPHGLIGQSFDGDSFAVDGKKDHYRELWWRQTSFKGREVTTEAQAEGAIEGTGGDYKLDDFFGIDFKYRRFEVAEAAPRNVSALTGVRRATGVQGWVHRAGTTGDDTLIAV